MPAGGTHAKTFAPAARAEPSKSAEDRLMLAVLQDALATFQRGLNATSRKEIDEFVEVNQWLRSRDYDSPFSFEIICCTLEIDANGLREGLNEVRRRAFDDSGGEGGRKVPRERIYTRRAWRGRIG